MKRNLNKKEICARALNVIKAHTERARSAYKLGVDLTGYDEALITRIEELVSETLTTGEDNCAIALDLAQWWLYESVEKKIRLDGGVVIDVEDVDDLLRFIVDLHKLGVGPE